MSTYPQLFRINPDAKESRAINEVDLSQLGFQERRDFQEWVSKNPSILGEKLLIIGKEFSGFDRTNDLTSPSCFQRDTFYLSNVLEIS